MWVHHCLITLKIFSADDTCYRNNGIEFIRDIDLSFHLSPFCCCDIYTEFSYSCLDFIHRPNILYFYTKVNSLKPFALHNLLLSYLKYGTKILTFKIHVSVHHSMSLFLFNHVLYNEYGPMKHVRSMDQEFEEIQCDCNKKFCWKINPSDCYVSYFRSCTYTFLKYVLLLTPCNDLFVLKKNRYKRKKVLFSCFTTCSYPE